MMCWKTRLVFTFPLILLLDANIEEVDVMVVVIWKGEVARPGSVVEVGSRLG